MTDLRLPTPLLNPSLWPEGETYFVSVFALLWGGPLRQRLEFVFKTDPSRLVLELPHGALDDTTYGPILNSVVTQYPGVEIRAEDLNQSITLKAWAEAVFHKTRGIVDDFTFQRLIKDYEQELLPKFATLDSLRFFPGFLRSQTHLPEGLSSLAALELARVTALFSPQSESGVGVEGRGEIIVANPTLEIIESNFETAPRMMAIARKDSTLIERTLDWQEAAVFDELRENPKTLKSTLIAELENHGYTLTKLRDFGEVIESLIQHRLLLRRES